MSTETFLTTFAAPQILVYRLLRQKQKISLRIWTIIALKQIGERVDWICFGQFGVSSARYDNNALYLGRSGQLLKLV